MNAVMSFAKNVAGRDFVVGDIHGCFERLQYELDSAGFDESKDRLFSVGDLVDRGPSSEDSIDWIAKPWFHAVRGNHEQIVVDACTVGVDRNWYESNGGSWFYRLSPDRQKVYGKAFAELPLAIEIGEGADRICIVHAEVFGDWDAFTGNLEDVDGPLAMSTVWGRKRIKSCDCTDVLGITALFVGHTPLERATRLGNTVYIDTGAVFGNKMTLVEVGKATAS